VVARTKQQDGEELVVTLTDARGAVIFQETCADGALAATRACVAIARRARMAGDMLRVTVPQPDGSNIHQPRETD
jgi:hypothetical protein